MSEQKPHSLGDVWKRERGITFFKEDFIFDSEEFRNFKENLPEPLKQHANALWKEVNKDTEPRFENRIGNIVQYPLERIFQYARSLLVANPRVGIVVTLFFLCVVLWAVAGPIERLLLPEQYWSKRVAILETDVGVIRSAMYRNVVEINVATDKLSRGLLTPEDYKQSIEGGRRAHKTLEPDLREREEELREARRKLAGTRR